MQTTAEIKAAAVHLKEMLAVDPPNDAMVDVIRDAEHRCDTLTHDTIQRLHRTFITPFDREDLYEMATSLDNVMDAIDAAAGLVRNYAIVVVPKGARELAHIVTHSPIGCMRPWKRYRPKPRFSRTRWRSTGSRTKPTAPIK